MSQEQAQTFQIPTRRAKDVAEATRQPSLKDGRYRMLVVGPVTFRNGYGEEGKHKLQANFLLAPLADPQDASSVYRSLSVFAKVTAPYGLGEDSPAISQKDQKKVVKFFNAILGDAVVPPLPRYANNAEGVAATEKSLDAVVEELNKLMADPTRCLNWAIDVKLGTFSPEPGKTYRTFQFMSEADIARSQDWTYDKPAAE